MSRRTSLILFGVLVFFAVFFFALEERIGIKPDVISGPVRANELYDPPNAPLFGSHARGNFAYYILSLTWSPSFCNQPKNNRRTQCSRERSRNLGFVVHGLWPQNDYGYPSFCDKQNLTFSSRDLDDVKEVFPDIGLARHQWRKHGSCTGLSPKGYLNDVRRARAQVVLPEAFSQPGKLTTFTTQKFKQALSEANPGLHPNMISVQCKNGELQELRICMDKNLKNFRRCGNDVRDTCRSGSVITMP